MADIKGLDIFGNNKGLAKIKKEAEAKKKQQAITPSENKQLEVHQVQEMLKDRVEEEQKKLAHQSESLIRFILPSIL